MPRYTPGRVQMRTSTTGNGPYTLTNPSPALTGKRTVAEAVADGSYVYGQQVVYGIVDPLAAGNAKMLEVGVGTISAGLVLTVITVLEKSVALTSGGGWGAGTRDVLISPPHGIHTAFTDLANIFTATQTIDGVSPTLQFTNGGALRLRELYSSNVAFRQYFNGSGVIRGSQDLADASATLNHYNTSGVLDGSLSVGAGTLEFNDGTTVRKVVRFVGGAVVKMTFNSAPPTGWTRINVTGERVGKYATVSDTPETQGGSWTVSGLSTSSGSTDGTALTIAHLPEHAHGGTAVQVQSGTSVFVVQNMSDDLLSLGGPNGSAHSHLIGSLAVNSTGAWRPAYEIVVKASFD